MILEALIEKRASAGVATALGNPDSWLYNWFGGGSSTTASGITVTESTALNIAAVTAAVNAVTGTMSSLPLKLYRNIDPRGKEEAKDDPLYRIMKTAPNRFMSSALLRRTMQGDIELWGNGYAEIERSNGGQPLAVHRRHPSRVTPEFVGGNLVYRIANQSKKDSIVPANDMLHVQSFSTDGIRGISPIRAHAETLGLSMAAERFGAAFFGNGTFFGGFIKRPDQMPKEAQERLRNQLEALHKGPDRAHRFVILDAGMDFQATGIPPEDAQLLETRTFQIREVARIFNVPPHMLADLADATFSNVEHLDLIYLKHSLTPRLVTWEQELDRKLLPLGTDLFFEHVVDGLLRSDFQTRTEGTSRLIQSGQLTPNEGRALDNRNPMEGGDRLYLALNLAALDEEGLPIAPANPVGPAGGPDGPQRSRAIKRQVERRNESLSNRWRIQESFLGLIEEAFSRILVPEKNAVSRQLKKMPEIGEPAFSEWLNEFYEEHRSFVLRVLVPVLTALLREVSIVAMREIEAVEEQLSEFLEEFETEYIEGAASRYTRSQNNQLQALLREATNPEEAAELIEERLAGWSETTAEKSALKESTQASNAVSRAIYAAAGVSLITWRANADGCPLCQELNGRTVSISAPFVGIGEMVNPSNRAEGVTPLVVKNIIQHPPLHKGCICSVSPG